MTYLHIIDHYSIGGAQRIVEGITRAMPEAVLLPLRKKDSESVQIPLPAGRCLIHPERNVLRQIYNLLQVPRLIRKNKIHFVHCHLRNSWLFGLWLSLVLRGSDRPRFIFHEHDSIKLDAWYYPFLARMAAKVGIIAAVSAFIKEHILLQDVPAEKVLILRNFVDQDRFSPGKAAAPERFHFVPLQNGTRCIGFAGRLVESKGWHFVIEAADRLREENIIFLIAGDGPDRTKLLQTIRQHRLEDRVFLMGAVDHMVDFYRFIHLLLITSERESFGLVQIEAQACGVPVVMFESQAAHEIHGNEAAVLVPYGDSETMVLRIRELFDDPDRFNQMARKGLANACNYNLPAYIVQLNQIYQRLSAHPEYLS